MNIFFKPVILWTDALIYFLVFSAILFILWARRKEHMQNAWRQIIRKRLAIISMVVLSVYMSIGLLDSLHFRAALPGNGLNGEIHYSSQLSSVFDVLIHPLGDRTEKTYSAPFALHAFVKESIEKSDGTIIRAYPDLKYAGQHILNTKQQTIDILFRCGLGLLAGAFIFSIVSSCLVFISAKRNKSTYKAILKKIIFNPEKRSTYRTFLITLFAMTTLICIIVILANEYHILGTNKVGHDVLYQTLKSIRTGLVIGTLTTLIMLPFAILLGITAGYFGGWIDDVIQYVYTTLSSVPGVLLIAASILSLQIFIENHPTLFHTLASRADARLLALCIILGITSWTGLCRMLRAETLKLREIDYIQAAIALGTHRFKILIRHVLPNVMHIVLIAVVLDFSLLILAEAVLSYVGVGVDPSAISWGNMINSARLELAREPIVWWPLLAAFIFMFILVLSANLFSDAVRDAFDPRLRKQ